MTQSAKNDANVPTNSGFSTLDDERPMTDEELRDLQEKHPGRFIVRFED